MSRPEAGEGPGSGGVDRGAGRKISYLGTFPNESRASFRDPGRRSLGLGFLDEGEVEAYRQRIPAGDEFSIFKQKFEELVELYHCYRDIDTQVHEYSKTDIWIDPDFESHLSKLENRCDCFSGQEFRSLIEKKKWTLILRTLKELYCIGNKILSQFNSREVTLNGRDHPLLSIETHESKATYDYSVLLSGYLDTIIDLWGKFQQALEKLPDEYQTLQQTFKQCHYEAIFQVWKKTRFWRLWEGRQDYVPRDWTDFFNMVNRVLQNHKTYVLKVETREPINVESLEILDPYIETHQSHQRNNSH